jgi:hypothetical protein
MKKPCFLLVRSLSFFALLFEKEKYISIGFCFLLILEIISKEKKQRTSLCLLLFLFSKGCILHFVSEREKIVFQGLKDCSCIFLF